MGTIGGNFFALAFFLLFQLCGVMLSSIVFPRKSAADVCYLGSVFGSTMLQWFPVPLAFFLGFSKSTHLLCAGIAVVLIFVCHRRLKRRQPPPFRKPLRFRAAFLFPGLLLIFYTYLLFHGFHYQDGAIYSSQATYGDMSMHLSFITSLAEQQTFPPEYSILPGTRLSYPFLCDSNSASLLLCGATLRFAYVLPMVFAAAQIFGGCLLLAKRWLKHTGKAILVFLLFFFNGGFGLLYFLNPAQGTFSRMFSEFYQTPTNYTEEGIYWVNTVVDLMLPQRATLFGWAVLFAALTLLHDAVYRHQKRCFLPAGVLFGSLPMIHTHSLLFAAVLCSCWLIHDLTARLRLERQTAAVGKGLAALFFLSLCVLQPVVFDLGLKTSSLFLHTALLGLLCCMLLLAALLVLFCFKGGFPYLLRTWGLLLFVVLVLALPQLLFWTFSQTSQGNFLKGCLNWVNARDAYLPFYLKNLGFAGILLPPCVLFCKSRQFLKITPALLAWFLAEQIRFQPNPYDNNKLLYPAYFLLCCLLVDQLSLWLRRFKALPAAKGLAGAGLALYMLPAILTMGREAVASYQLFDQNAIAVSTFIAQETDPQAVILTDTRHNNEVAALSGRSIVCGSGSYLYYHGVSYYQQEQAVPAIYAQPALSANLLHRYRVDYILITDHERRQYDVDEAAIAAQYACVYQQDSVSLYRVRAEEPPLS